MVVGDLVDAQPARHRRLPAGDPPGGQGPCHGLLLQLREVDQPAAGNRVRPPARVAVQTCRQRSLQLARQSRIEVKLINTAHCITACCQ